MVGSNLLQLITISYLPTQEMDDEIFFYCDTLDSLLSLADKSGEDFVIAGCFGFGVYEELL